MEPQLGMCASSVQMLEGPTTRGIADWYASRATGQSETVTVQSSGQTHISQRKA